MRRCIEAILVSGLDDWVQAAEIASIAKTVGNQESTRAIRDLAMRVIRRVLDDGVMEVGDVTAKGFAPWMTPVAEAMRRIEEAWPDSSSPGLGEVCWLCLTAKGQAVAEHL